jgi:hypothetical protein
MTREEFKNLKVNDLCIVRRGHDAGIICKVMFIDEESIVIKPYYEGIRFRAINTNSKIVDIAFKYQFSSQEAFTKAFKRIYGISPREFRRNGSGITPMHSIKSTMCQLSMAA